MDNHLAQYNSDIDTEADPVPGNSANVKSYRVHRIRHIVSGYEAIRGISQLAFPTLTQHYGDLEHLHNLCDYIPACRWILCPVRKPEFISLLVETYLLL